MPVCHTPQVSIVGVGLTGLSCLNYFLKRGITPRIMDSRQTPPGLTQIPAGIACHFGELNSHWLWESDLIVVSPGIDLHQPIFQALLQSGKEIVGDIELFARQLAQHTAPKQVIAITGSNGKTTVTTLVGEVLRAAGLDVAVGGNIGLPALQLLEQDHQYYVLELSSFQLETAQSLAPSIATVLNVTEDHMDRYPAGISEYRQAKLNIYHQSACCLVNYDDPLTYPKQPHCAKLISVGIAAGDYHLETDPITGDNWLCHAATRLLAERQLQIQGRHNLFNALVVFAIADYLGVEQAITCKVLQQFSGLAHRFQLVHQKNGVRWINDSKATNVGSTQAALAGLEWQGTLHLLLGGDGKGADFSALAPYLQHPKIRLYCYGRDGQKLLALNPTQGQYVNSLDSAMQQIAHQVQPGDIVLLSPACASLDQFKNYQQRGDHFAQLARQLSV